MGEVIWREPKSKRLGKLAVLLTYELNELILRHWCNLGTRFCKKHVRLDKRPPLSRSISIFVHKTDGVRSTFVISQVATTLF